MRTDVQATRAFPYVHHACPPEGDLRKTFLASMFFVPFGAFTLFDAQLEFAVEYTDSGPHWPLGQGTYVFAVAIGVMSLLSPLGAIVDLRLMDMLPNRVSHRDGSTIVGREVVTLQGVVAAIFVGILFAAGVATTFMDSSFTPEHPVMRVFSFGACTMAATVWVVGDYLLGRLSRLRMTPEELVYTWRGKSVTIPWDDLGDAITTNDVYDHEDGHRLGSHYQPGAKIAVPEHIAESTTLPIWRDGDTPRLLLKTEGYRVEASALLTVILQMRDHPELRPALASKACKPFFFGPPFTVRRRMWRTQVWWPKEILPEGVDVDRDGVEWEKR